MSTNGYVLPATQDYDFKYLSQYLPISLDKLSALHIELFWSVYFGYVNATITSTDNE